MKFAIQSSPINKTRFKEIGFTKVAPGLWRFVDLETGATVGPHYARKDELLADLTRYATDYGCSDC
jgi:predicted membrane protein